MGIFRLSRLAEADLHEIAGYTRRQWGEEQAFRYLDTLEECCQKLAQGPIIGTPVQFYSPRAMARRRGKSRYFFRRVPDGVRVVRILHQRMLPDLHPMSEDEA